MTDAHLWSCRECGRVWATDHADPDELPAVCICSTKRFQRIGQVSR